MNVSQVKSELDDLLENYSNGLYTSGEVVSNAMEFLDESNIAEVWDDFPSWLKEQIRALLLDFSESDEVVTFGRGDAELIKKQNLFVKGWLKKNNLI